MRTSIAVLLSAALVCGMAAVARGETAQSQDAVSILVPMDENGKPLTIPNGADGKPISFDIVSFRPYKEGSVKSGKVDMPLDGDFIAYHGQPLQRVLYFAFLVPDTYFQLSGEPGWVNNDLYDFTAKVAPENIAIWQKMGLTQKRLMVRNLLTAMLKMKVHQDVGEHPVYELVVAKGGPKMKEWKQGDTLKGTDGQTIEGPMQMWVGQSELVCQETTMARLVNMMSIRVGRPVIDKTGLMGEYNFTVSLTSDRQGLGKDGAPAYVDPDAPSTFSSVQQIGLKLQPAKAVLPAGVVIEHIEKPEAN